MKGYNLTEVLISLALSALVLGGLVPIAMRGARDLAWARREMRIRGSLEMAREELALLTRGLEPEFWERFPVERQVTGEWDHHHHGVAYRSPCDREPATDCMTLWDIAPGSETPVLFRAEPGFLEGTLQFATIDPADNRAASEVLSPMSVLLFYSARYRFCALVAEVADNEVTLLPQAYQPWEWPPEPQLELYEIAHLGRLNVTHCSLADSPDHGFRMIYHDWTADGEGWHMGRGKTTYGNLHTMVWAPCNEQLGDRLVLFGQADEAPLLSQPLVLEGLRFDREVHCASLEL